MRSIIKGTVLFLLLQIQLWGQEGRYSPLILNHHLYLGQNWVYPIPFVPKEIIFHPSGGVQVSWHSESHALRFTTKHVGSYGVQILTPEGHWLPMNVAVYPAQYQSLALAIQKMSLRGAVLQASFEKKKDNSTLLLSGTVYEPQDWIFFNQTLHTTPTHVTSDVKLYRTSFQLLFDTIQENLQNKFGPHIHISQVNQHITASGYVQSDTTKQAILRYLKNFFTQVSDTDVQTNVGTQEQVNITLQFIEVDQDQSLNMGFTHNNNQLSWSYPFNSFSFDTVLSLMLSKGKAKILSEPNLVVRHHKSATLHIGGEIPYEVKTRERLNIHWKQYGIQVQITPHPLDNHTYHLEFNISVSYPTSSVGLENLPGFTKRSIQSEVVVPKDQTALLSGLLQQVKGLSQSGLPVLSDIPILGHFFKQTTHHDKATELIIAITPRSYATPLHQEKQKKRDELLNEEINLEP